MLTNALKKLLIGEDLEECGAVFSHMLQEANESQTASFLSLLRAKGETPDELLAVVRELQKVMIPLATSSDVLDIAGTGGDGKHSVNISTAAAIVAASGGVKVVKHGNFSSSSRSGSADVLRALGITTEKNPQETKENLEKLGICFCLAPVYHPALKQIGKIRKNLSIPTTFNLILPLLNPVKPDYILLGVYQEALVPIFAKVLLRLGIKKALVFHSAGYDELTTLGKTEALVVTSQGIQPFAIDPQALGFALGHEEDLRGGAPEENARLIREVFSGKEGTLYDTILLNAAAGIYVAGRAQDLNEGIQIARKCLQEGKALDLLEKWKAPKNYLREILERKNKEVSDLKVRSRRSLKASILQKKGAVIAEIKRRSPSKGKMAEISDPVRLAREYARGGAAAISVLTDTDFAGSILDVRLLIESFPERPPLLRKDFMIDPIQLQESVRIGADAVLLIVSVVGERLKEMLDCCKVLGLEALVEIHDEHELRAALDAGAEIIGINHRNLKTFAVDLELGKKFLPIIPKGIVTVAESGIQHPEEAKRYFEMGFDAVLVGEALVKHSDPAKWIKETA